MQIGGNHRHSQLVRAFYLIPTPTLLLESPGFFHRVFENHSFNCSTNGACSVAASYKPPMLVTRVRLPACAECAGWPEGSRPPWIQHSTHFCQGSTVFANRGAQLWHCHERRNRTRSSRMGSQYEAIVLCACWKNQRRCSSSHLLVTPAAHVV